MPDVFVIFGIVGMFGGLGFVVFVVVGIAADVVRSIRDAVERRRVEAAGGSL